MIISATARLICNYAWSDDEKSLNNYHAAMIIDGTMHSHVYYYDDIMAARLMMSIFDEHNMQ